MVAAHIKRKRRSNLVSLASWLELHGIDPKEPCQGVPALQALQTRLTERFGSSFAKGDAKGNLVALLTGEELVHRDDARAFLWDKEVTIVEETTDGDTGKYVTSMEEEEEENDKPEEDEGQEELEDSDEQEEEEEELEASK